jgi:hypothetical protein
MTVAHVAAKPAPLPIRFALSDMPGHWCIRVTDVRSGLSREFGIQVH